MKFYAISTGNDSYEFHHSDVATAYHIIDGIRANGFEGCVLWGGGDVLYKNVPHKNLLTVEVQPEDILIVVSPTWAQHINTNERFKHLAAANERWWYPYTYRGGSVGGFWQHIFLEGYAYIDMVRRQTPDAHVHYCMIGAVHNVELQEGGNPYADGTRNLFYAGRLMATNPQKPPLAYIRQLAERMPQDMHIWVAAASLYIPPTGTDGLQYDASKVPAEVVGKTTQSVIGDHVHISGQGFQVRSEAFVTAKIGVAKELFSVIVNHPRVHYLGPIPYGSFWNKMFYSTACLDFGHDVLPTAPNCKILDPMRAGAPVIADGMSQSYYLIGKHRQGTVVPHRDADAAIRFATSLPPWNEAERKRAANAFCREETWHLRVHSMLRNTGKL